MCGGRGQKHTQGPKEVERGGYEGQGDPQAGSPSREVGTENRSEKHLLPGSCTQENLTPKQGGGCVL